MRKLIFILLAFLAVFTYIRTSEKVEAGEMPVEIQAESGRDAQGREMPKLASSYQPHISIDE